MQEYQEPLQDSDESSPSEPAPHKKLMDNWPSCEVQGLLETPLTEAIMPVHPSQL